MAAVAHAAADGCFLGIQRYKRRKDAVKAKLVALEEEDQARRTAQSKIFAETFSESEASALTGAFRNQIKAIRKREAEAQESRGETDARYIRRAITIQRSLAAGGRLNSILDKIDQGQGTLGLLLNDPTLYEEVKVLVGGANLGPLAKQCRIIEVSCRQCVLKSLSLHFSQRK